MLHDIKAAFASKEFILTDYQANQFSIYLNLLQEWNQKLNLVADSDSQEIIFRHFIDSLAVTKHGNFLNGTYVIDIGTGAGFPGIPLAIYTGAKFCLVDSLKKRLVFLDHVISELGLKNVECVHSRFEDLAHNPAYREKFDIAVCRAVAPLNVLLEYTIPFIKNNGILLAHKGSMLNDELDQAKKALKLLNAIVVSSSEYLDDKNIKRFIIEVKKESTISSKYPRKAGTPKTSPLI